MDKTRNKYLIRKYGITLKQYNTKLKEQNYCCEVCGKHKNNFKKSLHVDHDHKTGQVRGLLCYYCNRRIIGRHTLDSATRVYQYLLKYNRGTDGSK